MDRFLLYPVGSAESCHYASKLLSQAGFPLTDHPTPEITHLLLDIPSFDAYGLLRNGTDLKELLRMMPKTVNLIGGNLDQDFLKDYQKTDLLKDPYYLAKNAAITAECALQAAAPHLKTTFAESPALILGWGRIGKCLAKLLSALGCPVTVAARKESDRAMLEALGYRAVEFSQISSELCRHTILFNTVPDLPLHSHALDLWKTGIAIDLASAPGMKGNDVIPARGLPGKYAPESSGKLIAETILRMHQKEEIL